MAVNQQPSTAHSGSFLGKMRNGATTFSDMLRNDIVLLYTELRLLVSGAGSATSAGAGTNKEEMTGSKSKPHEPKRRRSSSLKRMSSVFGDWQVTNIRAAAAAAVAAAAGDGDGGEGITCEMGDGTTKGGLDTIPEQDTPPTKQELEELYAMKVLDRHRVPIPFGTLVKDSKLQRVVVVFIRHFFCGNCFGYVRALTNEMPISKLEAFSPPVKLIVIGCGDPVLVPNYIKMTGCPFELYADPSRELYRKLDFTVNTLKLDPTKKPKYVAKYSPQNLFQNIMVSAGLAVRSLSSDAGKISQNGGELVWANGELEFTHRMKHPADHLEIEELERLFKTRPMVKS